MASKPKWIARRRLSWLRGTTVTLSVGAPARVGPEEWRCPFHIAGLGRRPVQYAYGVDALQCLMNAFMGLRRELEPFRADLRWEFAADKGDFGIPLWITGAFGLAVTQRLESVVDRELDRLTGPAARRRRARAASAAKQKAGGKAAPRP
jgi:hypothetical protein